MSINSSTRYVFTQNLRDGSQYNIAIGAKYTKTATYGTAATR